MILAVLVQPEEFPALLQALNFKAQLTTTTQVIYIRQADNQWLWDGFDYYPDIAETRVHLPIFTFPQFASFSTNVTLDYLQSTYPEVFV